MEKIEPERMTFFRSYWIAAQKMPNKKDRLSFYEAIFSYAFDDQVIDMTPTAEAAFILVLPVLEAGRKRSSNGRKGGIAGKANRKQSESRLSSVAVVPEKQSVSDNRNKEEEKDKEKKESKKKEFGEFGWVRLTEDQVQKLLTDLGEEELRRCIRYVDESAQKTGNRAGWKDWNLVIRNCHRDGWGLKQERPLCTSPASADKKWEIHYD